MTAAILGYGKSGQAAHKVLEKLGEKSVDIFDDRIEGYPPVASFSDVYDMTVISPGIAMKNIGGTPQKIMSEVELAHMLKSKDSRVIAVTGTNGKSTVTTLIAQILSRLGYTAKACGNIGTTYADTVLNNPSDIYVLELSSFQIELLQDFKVDAAVVTNLAPDHLDRYSDYEEYKDAKLKIFEHVDIDGTVIIPAGSEISEKADNFGFNRVLIDETLEAYDSGENIIKVGDFSFDRSKYPLFGKHNLLNLVFALCAVNVFALLEDDVTHLVEGLEGLPHRCEESGCPDGVRFINDSKATNVYSTLACLQGAEKGISLMLGGRDKKGEFGLLADYINEKVKRLYIFGEAAETIYEQLYEEIDVEIVRCLNMKQTVKKSFGMSVAGDVVILSPACASFDEFTSFEERGDVFKQMVKELEESGRE